VKVAAVSVIAVRLRRQRYRNDVGRLGNW